MKNFDLSKIYQNVMITGLFIFLFLGANPAQRNEMIKITMNALDSANQVVIKVQTDSTTVSDTLKVPVDTVKVDTVK